MRALDLTGQRFGSWTVLNRAPRPRSSWICQCDCGNVRTVFIGALRSGRSESCGCLKSEKLSLANTRHGHAKHHTGALSPTYLAWFAMLNNDGRRASGLVDLKWHTFENFLADMGEKPDENRFLARLDGSLPYGPGNCEWRRKGLTFNDRTLTINEWSAELGIPVGTLLSRIHRWGLERALSEPPKRRGRPASPT